MRPALNPPRLTLGIMALGWLLLLWGRPFVPGFITGAVCLTGYVLLLLKPATPLPRPDPQSLTPAQAETLRLLERRGRGIGILVILTIVAGLAIAWWGSYLRPYDRIATAVAFIMIWPTRRVRRDYDDFLGSLPQQVRTGEMSYRHSSL